MTATANNAASPETLPDESSEMPQTETVKLELVKESAETEKKPETEQAQEKEKKETEPNPLALDILMSKVAEKGRAENPEKVTKEALEEYEKFKNYIQEHELSQSELREKDRLDESTLAVGVKRLAKVDEKIDLANIKIPEKEVVVNAASSILERRDWGNIYNNLKDGDEVINFAVPSDSFFSVKHLNDKVFGENRTDEILIAGRNILQTEFKQALLKEGVAKEIVDNCVLSQDYKNSIFKISAEAMKTFREQGVNVEKMIETVSETVEARMRPVVAYVLDKFSNEEAGKNKQEELKEFADSYKEVGYRLNYGSSPVEKRGEEEQLGYKDIALSTAAAFVDTKMMEVQRLSEELGLSEKFKFSEKKDLSYEDRLKEYLVNFRNLRKELETKSQVEDDKGNVYDIFEKGKDGNGNIFIKGINKDLFGKIRKDAINFTEAGSGEILKLYYRMLNIMDFVKPHTNEEMENGVLAAKLEERGKLIKDLKNSNFTPENADKTVGELLRDEKPTEKEVSEYTSGSEFKKRAQAIGECNIVKIDVRNVGLDQLAEYERLLLDSVNAENQTKEFNESILVASDKVTNILKKFRSRIADVVQWANQAAEGSLVVGKVGGDEMTLALSSEVATDQVLFLLKDVLNDMDARIVVAETKRGDNTDLGKAHDEAMKKVDEGIDKSKVIDDAAKELNSLVSSSQNVGDLVELIKANNLDTILKFKNNQIVADFAVIEGKDVEVIAGNDERGPEDIKTKFNYKEILDKIANLQKSLAQSAQPQEAQKTA